MAALRDSRPTTARARTASASASSGATPSQLRVLERNRWFAGLPPDLKQEVVRRATVRRHPARSLLYTSGGPPSGFYAVLAGEVRLEHVARSGKFAFYHSVGPGEMFGMLSELDGTPRFSDARAMGETTVLNLSHAHCQELLRHHPAARDAFVAYICENLHTTLDMLVEQHSAPARAQIASILVAIFSRDAADQRELPRLTHEAMAAMAGISRQTAGKVLHEFRAERLIEMQYGKVRPLDLARLQEIARL